MHSVVKGLGEVTENVRDEMLSHIRSFKEYFQPLLSEVEELRSFKEQTVGHQVKMIKQIKELQKEVDSIKEREGGRTTAATVIKAAAITALAAATITFTSAKILTIAMTVATTAAASRKRLIK